LDLNIGVIMNMSKVTFMKKSVKLLNGNRKLYH